jgi:POT family proton-dependent oligopeptide transporter
MQKMAIGALIVGAAYLVLAAVSALSGGEQASWLWLVVFIIVFTLGELYILPNGLGLFARLAPPRFGATTVAAWYLAIFSGSLAAGQVGRLWSVFSNAGFFMMLAVIATVAAGLLLLLDRPARRVVAQRVEEDRAQVVDPQTGIPHA